MRSSSCARPSVDEHAAKLLAKLAGVLHVHTANTMAVNVAVAACHQIAGVTLSRAKLRASARTVPAATVPPPPYL